MTMSGRQRPAVVLAGLIVLFFVALAFARRFADYLWYREVGYERVFLTKVAAQWSVGLTIGVICFLVLYGNLRIALRRTTTGNVANLDRFLGSAPHQDARAQLAAALALPAAILLSMMLGLVAAAQWRTLAMFWFRGPFGVTDPVFHRDIGYYVFTLPMLDLALDFVQVMLFVALAIMTIPVYLARGEIGRRAWRVRVEPQAQWHLALLGALLTIVTALEMYFVSVPSILQAPHGVLYGASYTDLHLRIPFLRFIAVLLFAAGLFLLWSARRGRLVRDATAFFGTYLALVIGLLGIVPAVFQRLVVQPNELTRETPQIARHIAATRAAWGIENVETRDLDAEQRLTAADIAANRSTINNVRLWDRNPLLETFGQIQAIRTYYDFLSVDDDRYRVNGELRQVLLSARELDPAALPTRTFINEHLTFTHGMGITLGPSNLVTSEGLPVLWIKDLPPASSVSIRVTRPQIYFGERANDFVLAPSRQRELDFPSARGDGDVYSYYSGKAGVPVTSLFRRLLFAFRFRSLNILLSSDLTDSTRILFHRSALDRAQLALPFLDFDRDPYLVVTDSGHLAWMLDAYTATDRYPYSQPIGDANYMRNSVKVVIDAYDGDIRAYLTDPRDPIVRALDRLYPGLLRPLAEMPADLRAHVRYPEDLFSAQTLLYATFHLTEPAAFYHREDQWQVPASQGMDRMAFLRHMVMRLPGERDPEFILMRPFTPRQKDNLAAWMVARNDGEHYGQLLAYRFPRQSLVYGPSQIVSRINQDTDVSRQISLWDQRGSAVIRGELLVIPIEQSLIYVQPLYLQAEGGRIPELKRVIVVHENRVAMEETLEAGLARLFTGAAAGASAAADLASAPNAGAAGTTPTLDADSLGATAALVREAAQHYERARAAQRADDWATYGTEMRRLGEILTRLRGTNGGGGGNRPR